MKKGNAIAIEQLEVGKAYSIAFGGVAYFVVCEKTDTYVRVDYPKKANKYRMQIMKFADHQDREVNGVKYQHRYQERLTIKSVLVSNSLHN
jgi:hypothetical protein